MLSLLAEDCAYSSLAYLGSYSTKQVCVRVPLGMLEQSSLAMWLGA
jgi:hypothetical protein